MNVGVGNVYLLCKRCCCDEDMDDKGKKDERKAFRPLQLMSIDHWM